MLKIKDKGFVPGRFYGGLNWTVYSSDQYILPRPDHCCKTMAIDMHECMTKCTRCNHERRTDPLLLEHLAIDLKTPN